MFFLFFSHSAPAAWDTLFPSAFICELLLASCAQCSLPMKRLDPSNPEGSFLELVSGFSLVTHSFTQQTAVEDSVALGSEDRGDG